MAHDTHVVLPYGRKKISKGAILLNSHDLHTEGVILPDLFT